jgi:hypothetical protein
LIQVLVTGDIVKQACSRMKPGKIDVTEAYTSDVFLHAPDYLFELLAAVFRSFLTHGTITLQVLSCAFLPLFKGGLRSPDKFDSYRAIAGASQPLKLIEYGGCGYADDLILVSPNREVLQRMVQVCQSYAA